MLAFICFNVSCIYNIESINIESFISKQCQIIDASLSIEPKDEGRDISCPIETIVLIYFCCFYNKYYHKLNAPKRSHKSFDELAVVRMWFHDGESNFELAEIQNLLTTIQLLCLRRFMKTSKWLCCFPACQKNGDQRTVFQHGKNLASNVIEYGIEFF